MKKLKLLHLGVAVLSLAAACAESPSKPGGAAPIAALSIQSSGGLLLGETATLAAVATLPGGQTQTVSGTWTSDNPVIAAVEASTGLVTGLTSGPAIVSVDYAGHRASHTVVVRPNYAGTWTGRYTVTECRKVLVLRDPKCSEPLTAAGEWGIVMQLSQSAGVVSGRVFVGRVGAQPTTDAQMDLTNPVTTGAISEDGRLTLVQKQTVFAWFQPVAYGLASYDTTIAMTADDSSVRGTISLKRIDFKDPFSFETSSGTIQRIAR